MTQRGIASNNYRVITRFNEGRDASNAVKSVCYLLPQVAFRDQMSRQLKKSTMAYGYSLTVDHVSRQIARRQVILPGLRLRQMPPE